MVGIKPQCSCTHRLPVRFRDGDGFARLISLVVTTVVLQLPDRTRAISRVVIGFSFQGPRREPDCLVSKWRPHSC